MANDKIFEELERFYLFPLRANTKIPHCKHGFRDGKTGLSIKNLKLSHNIGLALKISGLFVIDMDVDNEKGYDGIKTIKKLENELGELPCTLTQSTPRGGKHLIFQDKGITNPKGKIGKDVDLKYNGYIVVYPSIINGKQYIFTDGIDKNGQFIISELPPKWLDYINNSIKTSTQKKTNSFYHSVVNGDFENMYKRCDFIRYCVDNPCELKEPEWHLFAVILKDLKCGRELFHKYSEPHSEYNYETANKKFDNAMKYFANCGTVSKIFKNCNYCKYFQGRE